MSYGAGWKPEYVKQVEMAAAVVAAARGPVFYNPRSNPRWHLAMKAVEWGLLRMNDRGEFIAPPAVERRIMRGERLRNAFNAAWALERMRSPAASLETFRAGFLAAAEWSVRAIDPAMADPLPAYGG